jgi:hypothetical protein
VDRGEHDADRLRLPLGQEELCLSLALRVQDRGLFGACGGDPAVAEIEQMIHRKPRRGHIIYPHREQAGVVPSTPTGRFRVFRGATSSSVGARLATGWHQYAHKICLTVYPPTKSFCLVGAGEAFG